MRGYISSMPGWKSGVGRRLDALITRTVPGVRKAAQVAAWIRQAAAQLGWVP